MSQSYRHDVLIIGSGAAGLAAALKLPGNLSIAVLSKGRLNNGSTYFAQGGVAAVLDETDSIEAHVSDTLDAGGGLCREDAVHFTVANSREAINWLLELGVPFTRNTPEQALEQHYAYHLTREGGHSHRRIIHAADATGAAIFDTLLARARQHSNIHLIEHQAAIDLITSNKLGRAGNTCLGAYVLNRETNEVDTYSACSTLLATGGA